jgi:hypothetical protein
MSYTLKMKMSDVGNLPRQMHTRPRILCRISGADEVEWIAPTEDEIARIAYRRQSSGTSLDRACQRRLKPAPYRP